MTSSVIMTENEGLPIGTFVRFRENSNDEWRAGKILECYEQTDRETITYKYQVLSSWKHRPRRSWGPREGPEPIFVNHSDSLLQRVPNSEHEDIICSEFDRLVASCDVQVPSVSFKLSNSDCDTFGDSVAIYTTENGGFTCRYRHTEKMVIRFGTSLRQHCKDLKLCSLSCHSHFGLRAIEALVGDIASVSNPNVTELHVRSFYEPHVVDLIFQELLSKKKNMLRKLRLSNTGLLSLRFLEGLAGSLRSLNFTGVQLNDQSLEDLDEFFGMQTVMEQPVLQRLELFSDYSEDVAPFQQILHSLGKNSFLKALYLQTGCDVQLPRVVAWNIKQFLQETDVLEELGLEVCPLDPDYEKFGNDEKIGMIVEGRPLDDEDLDTILEGVCNCSSLKELAINADSGDKLQKIVTALETHAADKQQGVRVLRLVCGPFGPWETTFLKETKDFRFLLKQLDRLPALRQVHLQYGDVSVDSFLNEGFDKIVLDFLEHSNPLEVFEWNDIFMLTYFNYDKKEAELDPIKASADALCRANRMFNHCLPRLLGAPYPKGDKKDFPPRLWSTLLASLSPQANALFNLLRAYPVIVDEE